MTQFLRKWLCSSPQPEDQDDTQRSASMSQARMKTLLPPAKRPVRRRREARHEPRTDPLIAGRGIGVRRRGRRRRGCRGCRGCQGGRGEEEEEEEAMPPPEAAAAAASVAAE